MESPSPVEIISIDVPDAVLRKNMQNATSATFVAPRHSGLEEAREKFINAIVSENCNGKLLASGKAAYPGQAKQIIATESGESQILDEVGFVDDDKRIAKVKPPTGQVDEISSCSRRADDSSRDDEKSSTNDNDVDASPSVDAAASVARVGSNDEADVVGNKSSVSDSDDPVALDIESTVRFACALSDFSVVEEDYWHGQSSLDEEKQDEMIEKAIGDARLNEAPEQSCAQEIADDQRASTVREDDKSSAKSPKDDEPVSLDDKVVSLDDEIVNLDQVVGLDDKKSSSNDTRSSSTQVLINIALKDDDELVKELVDPTEETEEHAPTASVKTIEKQDDEIRDDVSKLIPTDESRDPSSISEENMTVMSQNLTEEKPRDTKDNLDNPEVHAVEKQPLKLDSNLEIDGKYLKSVVNSRKSPRKVKSGNMRVYSSDSIRRDADVSANREARSEEIPQKFEKSSIATKARGVRTEPKLSRFNSGGIDIDSHSSYESVPENRKMRYDGPLKGSLDSVISTSDPRTVPRRKSKNHKDAFTKKSKSYESIKRIQEVFLEEPSKTDSTSQLITSDVLNTQSDEFCSVCYYVNEVTMRTEEEISSMNQETFYTMRSNCSSLADEDSTECDICSSWNLQGSTEALDRKMMAMASDGSEPICEVCEICGEVGPAFDVDQEPMIPSGHQTKDFTDSQLSGSRSHPREIVKGIDGATTDPSLDDDSFEIENCGLPSGTESTSTADRGHFSFEGEFSENLPKESSSRPFYLHSTSLVVDRPRETYTIPKDEVAILSSGTRKINRKGSLMRKKTDDTADGTQDKRRYSSADNLQLAKVFTKTNKFLRSKGTKMIASADNIRTSRSSRRCKSLQRSADNVRYLDSSTDNLDSLAESLGKEDEAEATIDWTGRPQARDNETVKMILTKHGIKIISERETAL